MYSSDEELAANPRPKSWLDNDRWAESVTSPAPPPTDR